jgi:hypothetical protein
MAVEILPLPDPASPNVNDGVQEYDLAVGFTTLVDASAVGVEWFTPISAPGVTPTVKWWRVSDQALLASKSFTADSGVRQQVMLDAPVSIPAGGYRVSVHTIFFTLTFGWTGWPASSDNMVTANPDGWLNAGPGFPNSPSSSLYHVAPIIELDAAPSSGSVNTIIDLAPALTGARASAGALAGALGIAPVLTGARDSAGALGGAIALAPALAGARRSLGALNGNLGLIPALSGVRGSAGALAGGITISAMLRGTNGESGRPVTPYPHPVGPVSGFPWATRPVKSFQEVPTP